MNERPKPPYPHPFDAPFGATDDKKTDYLKEFSDDDYVNKKKEERNGNIQRNSKRI